MYGLPHFVNHGVYVGTTEVGNSLTAAIFLIFCIIVHRLTRGERRIEVVVKVYAVDIKFLQQVCHDVGNALAHLWQGRVIDAHLVIVFHPFCRDGAFQCGERG